MIIASWIWVLIPLAAIGIAPFKMWLRIKEKQIGAQTDLAAEKSAQYASHVERIEARLRVLEQIVTDGGAQTAARSRRCATRPASRWRTRPNEPVRVRPCDHRRHR